MDYIFYTIYNSYYKDGNYNNDIPSLTVGGIFTLVFFCLFLSFVTLFGIDDRIAGLNKTMVTLMAFGFGVLTYFVFYYNKRYIKIYDRFKDNSFANSWPGRILGWVTIALMILSPFIVVFIERNFH